MELAHRLWGWYLLFKCGFILVSDVKSIYLLIYCIQDGSCTLQMAHLLPVDLEYYMLSAEFGTYGSFIEFFLTEHSFSFVHNFLCVN